VKINPVGDRLFIKVESGSDRSHSGLYLPAESRAQRHVVAAAGPESTVREGAIVILNPKESGKITVEGEAYFVTRAADLLAVLSEETTE
jgi:chaperonin GroES